MKISTRPGTSPREITGSGLVVAGTLFGPLRCVTVLVFPALGLHCGGGFFFCCLLMWTRRVGRGHLPFNLANDNLFGNCRRCCVFIAAAMPLPLPLRNEFLCSFNVLYADMKLCDQSDRIQQCAHPSLWAPSERPDNRRPAERTTRLPAMLIINIF